MAEALQLPFPLPGGAVHGPAQAARDACDAGECLGGAGRERRSDHMNHHPIYLLHTDSALILCADRPPGARPHPPLRPRRRACRFLEAEEPYDAREDSFMH